MQVNHHISGAADLDNDTYNTLSKHNMYALEFWKISRHSRGFILPGEKITTVEVALKQLGILTAEDNPVADKAAELRLNIIKGGS